MSTKRKIITGIIIAIVITISFIVLMINVLQIPEVIRCEKLTEEYGPEFNAFVKDENGWIIKELKVLGYENSEATVYCVWCTPGEYLMGSVNIYRRISGEEWSFVNEQVVWSNEGTIDGVVMPYWWHWFIY